MLGKQHLGLFMAILPFVVPLTGTPIAKTQGLQGYVYRVSGNQMPSPDKKPAAPKGMKTTLYVYALTNVTQTVRPDQGPFYTSLKTKLVKKVQTNSKGYFSVQLPVGKYSLFTRKDSLYFANIYDGANNIYPVEVLANQMTKVEFKVDYDAAY